MNEQFSIFRRFSNIEQINELALLLKRNKIEYRIGDNTPPIDITFTGGGAVNNQIEIRIKGSDFNRAEKILEEESEKILQEINEDYYLFKFNNDELYEILLKPDEWNNFDYVLAQKLLKKRGKSVDKSLLLSLKEQRIKELARPDPNHWGWVFAGYTFALLGGFLGLIIGYFLWTSKKTLPNGNKVYSYSEKDRRHGKYIFFIGLILMPTMLIINAILEISWNSYL